MRSKLLTDLWLSLFFRDTIATFKTVKWLEKKKKHRRQKVEGKFWKFIMFEPSVLL